MKKKLLTALCLCVAGTAALGLAACNSNDGSNGGNGGTPPGQESPSESQGVEIKGVAFSDLTATYDGTEKKIEVTGVLPEGVTVKYSDNVATDAGTYNAKATLSGEGYKTKVLNATLKIEKAVWTGLTFTGQSLVYDGDPHTVSVVGELPSGGSIVYTCKGNSTVKNTATDAGTYEITAELNHKNYKLESPLTATLKIDKAIWTGLTFNGDTVDYDGKPHSIVVAGVRPDGAKIVYSCKENSSLQNTITASGTYTISAELDHKNYKLEAPLTAKLVIRATGKDRYVASHNGTLYFANALDNDKLYSYTTADGVSKISNDVPKGFTAIGSKFYFQSNSLLFSSIKSIDSTGVESVAPEKGEYLCTDGTYLYYVQNGLTNDKSGIYKINPSASEPMPVLVSAGKADNLCYMSGYLYFADGANGNKLSKVSASATGASRTVVVDEKITCLTANGGSLYFTVNNLLGDYIARYDVSSNTTVKLTQDAGNCLTVVGNDLYYVNVDLLSSTFLGKGIYKVDAKRSSNSNAVGEKVIESDNSKYSSLTLLSNGLIAYYRVDDQMLCTYNVSSKTETEILAGFVAPETIPLSKGSKTVAYGTKLYYLDIYNDKALYSYDTISGEFVRITSCKVTDFSIIGDTLYFNGVSWGVNNDLFKVSLTEGGLPEKISTYDCNDIVTDGTNLFYVEKNAASARTAVHIVKPDGTDEIMYTKGATCLNYYNGYIYFLDGDKLYKMPVTGYTQDAVTEVCDKKVDLFVMDGGLIYFREKYGVGQKRLSVIGADGSGYSIIRSSNTDPIKIEVVGNKIYYYSDTTLGNPGIYVIDKDTRNENKEPTLLLARGSSYFAEEFTVIGNKIYFVNYYNNLGDSHLYSINTTGANQTPVKLA